MQPLLRILIFGKCKLWKTTVGSEELHNYETAIRGGNSGTLDAPLTVSPSPVNYFVLRKGFPVLDHVYLNFTGESCSVWGYNSMIDCHADTHSAAPHRFSNVTSSTHMKLWGGGICNHECITEMCGYA